MADKIQAPTWLVHMVLVLVYSIFAGGALISKYGMYGSNPVVYELAREVCTLCILWPAAFIVSEVTLPDRRHASLVIGVGFFFFCNQACFFTGLKLTDPVSAATWQASIPCFCAGICALCGLEELTTMRAIGFFCASCGAALLAYESNRHKHTVMNQLDTTGANLLGHLILFVGVVGVAGYIICTKRLLKKYGAFAVTTWAFTVSAFFMTLTLALAIAVPRILKTMCYDTDLEVANYCRHNPFTITGRMIVPILYEAICCSVIAWSALAWANQHALASTVSLYSVTQPIAAACLAFLAVQSGYGIEYGIEAPGVQHAPGAMLIISGLIITIKNPVVLASNGESDHLLKPHEHRKQLSRDAP